MTFLRFIVLSIGLVLSSLTLSVPAHALIPGLERSPAETDQVEAAQPAIPQDRDTGDDARITQRIEGIFSELQDFENVAVETNDGVVRLSGSLPNASAIDRAENIAARISGVVTVENHLERDLSVEQNLSILGESSDLLDGLIAGLPLFALAAFVALMIGLLGYLIAGIGRLWDKIAPNAFLGDLIRSAIRFFFVVAGLVIALDMVGAGALLGAVLGGAGVIGIAMGFAMRDTIENYVASLMLSLRQPFRPNDHVVIDNFEGLVIRLTSRATILMTLEGNHLRIPNAHVFKAVIVNFTRNPQRRFDFELGIDADDDPRAAMQLGQETLAALPFVLDTPEASGRVERVGDSSIVIRYLAWVDQQEADWFKSRSLAIAAVKEALEGAGFALPEPIYRLRFDGRSDPLPISRSAKVAETKPETPPETARRRRAALEAVDEDVKPESEISDMVEQERRVDPERAKDLLDTSRPVE